MYYYSYSVMIFFKGKIRDAFNFTYSSEKPATIVDFKNYVRHNIAGSPQTYSAIFIPHWQEIDKATFDHLTNNPEPSNIHGE